MSSGIFDRFVGTLGKAVETVLEDRSLAAPAPASVAAAPVKAAAAAIADAARGKIGDAIDQVLAGAGRATAATSLRDSDVMNSFRDELTNGFIRADTVNQLLQIIDEVITRLL